MRALIQRVSRASVHVDGQEVASIGRGYLVLLGVARDDCEAQAAWLARKIAGLRLFEDDAGKMNLDLAKVEGAVLAVSQFPSTAMPARGGGPVSPRRRRPRRPRNSTPLSVNC